MTSRHRLVLFLALSLVPSAAQTPQPSFEVATVKPTAPADDPTPNVDQDSTLPSLFTALRETLGLELKAQQTLVQVLVIDRIDGDSKAT